MLSFLFIAALWSPAGERVSSWFVLVCSFPICCLCQVWYLILTISDLYLLLYCYFVCKILTEEQQVDHFVYCALKIHEILY